MANSAENIIFDDHSVGGIGWMRSYYDATKSNFCQTILVLGVGTGMSTKSYDILASEIAANSESVTFIADPNPWWLTKNSETKFAKLTEYVRNNIEQLIPECVGVPIEKLIIGGHSASGGAAWRAIPLLGSEVDGYLGLDPYRLEPDLEPKIRIPTMNWGLSRTSCGVTASNAAKAGYQATEIDAGRIFYQVDNNDSGKGHCDFADNGCYGPICAPSDDVETVRQTIALSVNKFILSLYNNSSDMIEKEDFMLPLQDVESVDIELFVNDDSAGQRRTMYLRK